MKIKKTLFVLLSGAICLIISCEDLSYLNDCYSDKPLQGDLTVNVSVQENAAGIPVKVLQGKFEDNNVLLLDTLAENEKTYSLPVNTYYTVSAEYNMSGKVILVIDGGEIKVSRNENENTSEPCWVLKNVNLNLELK